MTNTMNRLRRATVTMGQPGIAGTGINAAEKTALQYSTQLLDTRTVDARTQGLTGDGVQVGTAAFTALMDAGAGREVVIPRGYYVIDGPIPVKANTRITIAPGTVIEQKTKYTAVFDCLNVDNVVIDGNGAWLKYLGDRTHDPAGPSARGDDAQNLGSGIWSNGSYNHFFDINVRGFLYGIYLSSFDGTKLADYAKFGNVVENCILIDCNSGLLVGGQVNGVFRNIQGNYLEYTGKPDPEHLLYVTRTGKSRNLLFENFVCYDGGLVGAPTDRGAAFQIKGVDGGIARNMYARNCTGLIHLQTCKDFSFSGRITDDIGLQDQGSVVVESDCLRCTVDVEIAANETATGYRIAYLNGSDNTLSVRGRINQTTTSDGHYVYVNGVRNTLDFEMDNTDSTGSIRSTGRRGVQVATGNYHTVRLKRARALRRGVDVEVGAMNCVVEINSPHVEPLPSANLPMVYMPELSTTIVRNGRMEATINGAGQSARLDPTHHATAVVNVMTADAFTIGTPHGTPTLPRGMRIAYVISNKTAGALGTITWNNHSFATTWTNPAAGQDKSIEFVWDGARWKEIGRTA